MKNLSILFVCILLVSCKNYNPKIYQWRDENRNGIYNENNLLKSWTENGPEEIWHIEDIGNGYGSPTITEDEIFITGEIDSLAYLHCFDLEGNLKWNQNFGKEWSVNYPGSRSAPTIVDNLIYVSSGMGNLYCMKRETGKIVWFKRYEDYNGILPRFGHSEAAVIDNDKIFWTTGGKEYNVIALNRFSGELIWNCKGFGERPGYNPGNLINLKDRNIFVTFSAYHLMGIDTQTGKLLWTHIQDNTPEEKRKPGIGDTHSNNIIFEDGYIYYAAGDGNCGVKLKLSDDGTQITEIWRNKGFDSYMGGIVKIGNFLYGSGTTTKYLKSIDTRTGILADSLEIGSGTIIEADDLLYYYNQMGELSLISYNDGKMEQISSFKINRGSKEHFSHPVIKNGILYQRHGNSLMTFNIKQKNT